MSGKAPLPPWRPDALQIARRAAARARSPLAPLLTTLYRFRHFRALSQSLCTRLEGGLMQSRTWRDILHRHHGVEVGRYSYGDVLRPGCLPPGTRVGAYCSVGTGLIVRRRDHPVDRPILHPFFYNSALGLLERDTIPAVQANPLSVGHDVWIGDRVTIVGGCRSIGNGAVIAAGAIVTRDVDPYTVVAGIPARALRKRFDETRIAEIEASRWWERDLAALIEAPPFDDIFGDVRRAEQGRDG